MLAWFPGTAWTVTLLIMAILMLGIVIGLLTGLSLLILVPTVAMLGLLFLIEELWYSYLFLEVAPLLSPML
ncbi:MAG: hypothetical protein V5A66_03490 [Candidatus Thermoplasmatota archaeon]